jgi:RNA polymerase sigma factor (sigma-70 family)
MGQRDRLLEHIRRIALVGIGERRTDGQLLELFISERDETAFALLLRRHGAMVWSVCRRILGNAHDADDAFQAAFLVLVRKADSIRPREAVGNWLHGVACRTALEARGRLARRRAKELSLQDVPLLEDKREEPWQELWPILDRELSRLSDKYRLPIVLCDLEGRSRKDVARQLAIPEGTLSSRLATARKKLAVRLARYGFVVSAASLGILLAEKAATASLSFSLLSSTTKAAMLIAAGPAVVAGVVSTTVSTLTEGVLKAMFIAKIKTATMVLCGVAAFGVGTGGVYYQTQAGAADSTQVDRVVQENRNNNRDSASKVGISEIDKLKRENQQLKDMLESERNRQEVYREKVRTSENNITEFVKAGLAVRKDEPDDDESDGPDKPAKNAALKKELAEKIKAERDQLKGRFQNQAESLQARMRELEAKQKALEAQRRQLDAQLRALQQQRRQLEQDQKRMKESLQRQAERQAADMKDKIKREQAERQAADLKDKIKRQQAANQNQSKNKPVEKQAGGGDKLDLILQRLERMEKRLNRLERDRD